MTAICARTDRSRLSSAVEVLLQIVDRAPAARRSGRGRRAARLPAAPSSTGTRTTSAAFPCSPVATVALTTWPPSDSVRSSAFWAARETPSESATSTVSVALMRCARVERRPRSPGAGGSGQRAIGSTLALARVVRGAAFASGPSSGPRPDRPGSCGDVVWPSARGRAPRARDRDRRRRRHGDERDAAHGRAEAPARRRLPGRSARCLRRGDLADARPQRGRGDRPAGRELVDQVRRRHRVSSSLPAFRVLCGVASRPQ